MKTNESATQTQDTQNASAQTSEPSQDDFARELLTRILPHADPEITKQRTEPRHTPLGTPCARSWDDAWVKNVGAVEQRLQRRICGARTIAGNPCELLEPCKSRHDRPLNGYSYPDPNKLSEWTVKILLDHIKKKDPPGQSH